MGALSLTIVPSHGGSGPMVPWTNRSPEPKRHLYRFSHFAWLISVTDRPTDHTTLSVTLGHVYVRTCDAA